MAPFPKLFKLSELSDGLDEELVDPGSGSSDGIRVFARWVTGEICVSGTVDIWWSYRWLWFPTRGDSPEHVNIR